MTIYEIDKQIADLLDNSVDPETGELVLNYEALEQLQMDRKQKIENACLYAKNKNALVEAMKEEKRNLTERIAKAERDVARIEDYILFATGGQKFETAKVQATFRESEQLTVGPEFEAWAKEQWKDLLREKTTLDPDKTKIKQLLKQGKEIPYVGIEKKTNVTIK